MVCSISKVTKGNEGYYTNLSRDDYYTQGGEAPGRFLGKGAKALSLEEEIQHKDPRLKELFYGHNPNDGTELRRGAYTERSYKDERTGETKTHKPVCAWDLTFSAPKSVSVLWSQADPETRERIEGVHDRAVTKAASYLESEGVFTRTGSGGNAKEKVAPIFAAFQHSTSRELDPQLHTHLLLVNTGIRSNGKGGSIDGRSLLPHQFTLGAIYQNELRHGLEQDLKVNTTDVNLTKGKSFRIDGVPSELCQEFSKRRAELEKTLLPTDTPKQVQTKVLSTRKTKTHDVSRESLFSAWQGVGKEKGFDPKSVTGKNHGKFTKGDAQALSHKVSKSLSYKPVIRDRDLLHTALKHSQGKLSLKELQTFTTSYKETHLRAAYGKTDCYTRRSASIRESQKKPPSQGIRRAVTNAIYRHKERKRKAFSRRITFLYAVGKINRQTYHRIKEGKGLPTTQGGVHFHHATYRISTKQRDYLLSKLKEEKQNQPRTPERAPKQQKRSQVPGRSSPPKPEPSRQPTRERDRERERER